MAAYNSIDELEKELLARLRSIRAQKDALRERLVNLSNKDVIDTDIGAAGGSVVKGSQRMTLLNEEEKNVLMQLAALPYDEAVPVAMGTNTIGDDVGQTVLS